MTVVEYDKKAMSSHLVYRPNPWANVANEIEEFYQMHGNGD